MAVLGRKNLGLAIGSRSIGVAELSADKPHTALFQFEEGELKNPAELGKKFAAFLKQKGFSSSQAVAGVPAQWLMLKDKQVPPAAPIAVASILRIQAERDFSMEPSALALDYIDAGASGTARPVVLTAILRERLEGIKALAKSAGLKLQAVTGTTLALTAVSGKSPLIYLSENGAEFAAKRANGLPLLRYMTGTAALETGEAGMKTLAMELRRTLALQSSESDAAALVMIDDANLIDAEELSDEINMAVVEGNLPGAQGTERGALALAGLRSGQLAFDFLHSRLEIKPQTKLSSKVIWAAVAGLVVFAGGGFLLLDDWQNSEEVAMLQQKREEMKPHEEDSKNFIGRLNKVRTWYDRRPDYLECLRAITLCFPEDGRVWTSNLSLREDMRGVITGRAADEKSVLEVMDKLKSSKAISNVKMLNMHGSGTKGGEITFAIGFVYVGAS